MNGRSEASTGGAEVQTETQTGSNKGTFARKPPGKRPQARRRTRGVQKRAKMTIASTAVGRAPMQGRVLQGSRTRSRPQMPGMYMEEARLLPVRLLLGMLEGLLLLLRRRSRRMPHQTRRRRRWE